MDSREPRDGLIDAAVAALGLPMETEWRAAVRNHLAVTFRLAKLVEEFDLPDEAEPAPVFRA